MTLQDSTTTPSINIQINAAPLLDDPPSPSSLIKLMTQQHTHGIPIPSSPLIATPAAFALPGSPSILLANCESLCATDSANIVTTVIRESWSKLPQTV
jgi:hypothetical protein